MAWPSVLSDLRTSLSDNETDKLEYRKRVLNTQDGTNTTFKTFEWRRLTDFTGTDNPAGTGVFVNGSIVTVIADNPSMGEFSLALAPSNTDTLEASYYSQWFLDNDLQLFINEAVQWLTTGTADATPEGLKPAALAFACSKAYKALALKTARNYSEQYRMEDSPNPNRNSPMQAYMDLAKSFGDDATALRDQFYRRAGQALQPLTAVVQGQYIDIVPRR